MRKVLVPVDFSEASANALSYAVEFAKKARLQICLLHVYDFLIFDTDDKLVPSTDELIVEYLQQLESIREKIYRQHGRELSVDYYCQAGTVLDTINRFAGEHRADLIIMGMQGGGYLSEKIIGSTATSLMRKAVCPVLGIGRQVKYQRIERVALATDYGDLPYSTLLKPLKTIVQAFDTELFLVHVGAPGEVSDPEKGVRTAIGQSLEEVCHTVHTVFYDDVFEGIDQFAIDHDVQIIAVIPHRHSFFHALFHEANTKKFAFHTHLPLLALHTEIAS